MIWSPAITAVLIGIVAAFSFGGGFALGDWRINHRLERLESDNKLLSAANDRCAQDMEKAVATVDRSIKLVGEARKVVAIQRKANRKCEEAKR